MKNVSNTMYRIGRIVNVILLIAGILLSLIGLICVIVAGVGTAAAVAASDDAAISAAAGLMATAGGLLGYGICLLVGAILAFIFVGKAQRELANEQSHSKTPFIITIIFGAIAENIFFVLAGIFGIIAEIQEEKQANANVVDAQPAEQPAEEPKEE